jgi:flagellar hook-basal body complex protein FliE
MDMSLSSLSAVSSVGAGATTGMDRLTLDAVAPGAGASTSPGVDFAKVFDGELSRVNTDLQVAESSMRDYASGKPVELHELMINLERARVSVQVFVQVRNKIVESYQDLMRMQM